MRNSHSARPHRGPTLGRALAAFVALAALLAACAPAQQPAPAPAVSGTASGPATAAAPASAGPSRLTIGYTVDVTGAPNPFAHTGSTEYARWFHIFDTLVRYDEQAGAWAPLLAESWSTPDPTTWVFKLRSGVQFHDRSPLTADDVVFSYQRRVEDKDSKQAAVLGGVQSVEAVDPATVRITTKEPDASFLSRADTSIILSKAQYERLGPEAAVKQPLGTGPYTFKEYVPGQRLVVAKNPRYWGTPQPAWDEVVFRSIPEDEARVSALLNGEVDVIANLPIQSIDRVNGSGRATATGVRGSRIMFVALNPIIEPLKSLQVRQAIAHAIDKEALIHGILQDHAYRLDGPLGPGMLGYTPDLGPRYDYDPARAKQLLAQAGYADGFDVDFYTTVNRFPKDKEIATALVNMLNQVGIRAKLQLPEFATYIAQFGRGEYAAYYVGRGDVTDPSEYLQQYFRTGVTKRINFSDPEVDRLLAAQARELDPAKRVALLRDAQAKILEQVPVVFLYQYQDVYGASSRVEFAPRMNEMIFAWDARPKR
jgi:peptide/nickel transport system substrate-binding protein